MGRTGVETVMPCPARERRDVSALPPILPGPVFEFANSLVRRAEATSAEVERDGYDAAVVARLRGRLREAAYAPLRPFLYYGASVLRKRDREAVESLTDEVPGKHLRRPLRAVWWSAFCVIPFV